MRGSKASLLEVLQNCREKSPDQGDFSLIEILRQAGIETGEDRSGGNGFFQPVTRGEEIDGPAVVIRRFASNEADILHAADKRGYRRFVDPERLADLFGHGARASLENKQDPELCCADAEGLAERRIRALQQAMLCEGHEVKKTGPACHVQKVAENGSLVDFCFA